MKHVPTITARARELTHGILDMSMDDLLRMEAEAVCPSHGDLLDDVGDCPQCRWERRLEQSARAAERWAEIQAAWRRM